MTNLAITFTASILIWVIIAGLIYLWVIDGRVKKEQVVHAIMAGVIAWTISQIIKTVFPTMRPYQQFGLTPLTIFVPSDSAFPSAHSALIFAIAVTIWLHDRKIGSIFMMSALLIGLARVIANVHFPIDIVGGAVIGTVTSLLIERVHFPGKKA